MIPTAAHADTPARRRDLPTPPALVDVLLRKLAELDAGLATLTDRLDTAILERNAANAAAGRLAAQLHDLRRNLRIAE